MPPHTGQIEEEIIVLLTVRLKQMSHYPKLWPYVSWIRSWDRWWRTFAGRCLCIHLNCELFGKSVCLYGRDSQMQTKLKSQEDKYLGWKESQLMESGGQCIDWKHACICEQRKCFLLYDTYSVPEIWMLLCTPVNKQEYIKKYMAILYMICHNRNHLQNHECWLPTL